MSTYSLIPSTPEYVSLSDYTTSTHPAEYMAVSGLDGFGQHMITVGPHRRAPARPSMTSLNGLDGFVSGNTVMWVLLAAATSAAGLFYWKMRKAGVSVLPLFGLDGLGHSGRTAYGVFPKHRGYGHHRTATGRFHFHR